MPLSLTYLHWFSINHHVSYKMSSDGIERITTDKSYPVAGPYVPATIAPLNGRLIHVSGQIPGKPDGTLVQGTISEKAEACIANIKAILEASGSDMDHVLKVGIYVTDISTFKDVNAVFAEHFTSKPARSTVEVSKLPLGVEVEMDCTAVTKSA